MRAAGLQWRLHQNKGESSLLLTDVQGHDVEARESEGFMRRHELKCDAEPYRAIEEGRKPWEFRRDDRGFMVGDELILKEWIASESRFTGNEQFRAVGYILRGPSYGIPEGFCVMTLEEVPF